MKSLFFLYLIALYIIYIVITNKNISFWKNKWLRICLDRRKNQKKHQSSGYCLWCPFWGIPCTGSIFPFFRFRPGTDVFSRTLCEAPQGRKSSSHRCLHTTQTGRQSHLPPFPADRSLHQILCCVCSCTLLWGIHWRHPQRRRFFIVRYLGIYLLYFKQLRIECMVNLKNSLLDNKVYVL